MGSSIELSIGTVDPLIFELPLDLLSGPDKCYSVHRSHHSLFDDFSGHVTLETLCDLNEVLIAFIFDITQDQLKNGCVDVTRTGRVAEIYLSSTISVSSKSSIVLHTVTGAINMHMKSTDILCGIKQLHSS